ncbi:formin-binding protein 4 [Octopus sinensis]|uniref:Formin-binding protein 4 n=1 Tax=Octopus sinensis TaxID=2607531 RepID=A0A6P7U145_9MOLL|nr:formin-binding protein 4 [Octopus sinensis]
MGRRGMPGRRRQLIQLDNAPKTSYLTQTGCYRPDDIFIESKNVVKSSLSLVCDYTGSDSESEEESDKGENDSTLNRNGDDVSSGNDAKDNLHAEMLGIVGTKVETPSDIFRREFNAYQKETAAPSYNREFIAFQKETSPSLSTSSSVSTEMVTTSTTQSQKANVPLKENSTTSADSKTVSGSTETLESVSKSSDIDSQVASFLAEIDALGEDAEVKNKEIDAEDENVDSVVDSTKDDQSLGSDAKEGTDASGEAVSVVASYKSSEDSSSGEEEPVVWPEEPVSEWQQCHDESTQHYYYWNINSNEVTWEIPPEFTQYLLLYKEYELTLSRLIKEGKTKPKKKKTKSKRDLKKKNGQDKSESSAIATEEKTVSESAESSEPQPDDVIDKKEKILSEETYVEAKLVQETASPDVTENTQCLPGNSENVNNEETMESDSKISSTVSSSPVAESLEMTTDKYTEGTACVVDGNGAHMTNNANCNSSTSSSSSNTESLASTVNISDLTIEMCKKKFKARMQREDTTSNKQEQQATLELNLDTDITTANNKEASLGSDSEQSNIDIDEVDRELELALERKVNELRRLEEEEKQCEVSDRHHMKRKHKESDSGRTVSRNSSDEDYCMSKPPKKSKTHKHASKRTKEKKESSSSKRSESSKKRSSHKDHQSKKESRSKSSKSLNYKSHSEESLKSQESNEKLKETVMDLNQLVMDKMDFLEIDINKPSKLQVLLVQLKTRSSDWQAGGLSTSYFFERLQEANQQIIQFEKSGAPTGWSVCWDRTYKRYFYCNNTTGHSQWDYPEQPTKEELNGMSESMQQSLTLALSSTPPPPPPTPPPTPSPSMPSSSSSSSTSSATTTTTTVTSPVHESTKTASPIRSTSSEKKINYCQESGEITKCSDNFKKEKKNRKLDKIASKSSKTGSTLDKSHLEHLHLSSSKDFDSELCVYPGEPPPPGTEVSKQHSLQHLEEVKLSKSGEEDLEEVMKLAAVLAPTGTSLASSTALSKLASLESSERTSPLDVNDDMELDPDENLPLSVHHLPMHSSSSYKGAALSSNSNSNGHHLFPLVDAANCQNNSAVISKPPQYKTRPTVPSDPVGVTLPTSNSDTSTVYSSKTNSAANSSMECFSLSKSSAKVSSLDSANTSSNSPVSHETNDAVDPVKPQPKEKKRKKDKVITSTNLTLKKKNVSSLVQKWQKVKKEVEKEDELARHEFSDDD